MAQIFLSYRRADGVAAGARTAIYQALTKHYGARSVFMDVERLQLAQDFRASLAQELRETDLMIVLIGPAWVPLMRERGGSENDFVRIEIESALAHDKPIMPLLLGDAVMPKADELPESIETIAFNHGVQLDTGRYFEAGMAKLIGDLDEHVFASFARTMKRRRLATAVAAIVGLGALGAGGWLYQDPKNLPSDGNGAVTESAPAEIARNTGRIADSLENISEQFAAFGRAGGVIADARQPHELYHNAITYQERGDVQNARKAYATLLTFKLDKLDPYLRFAELVRAQEGPPGAQRALRGLGQAGDPALRDYALALQQPLAERRASLVHALKPEFAPAHYHLAGTYSSVELAGRTLAEIRRETELLKTFQRSDTAGHLLRWLIDQRLASQWRDDAKQRLVANQARATQAMFDAPVNMSWFKTNIGWMGNIQIAEAATQIEWRTAENTQFRATPMTANIDQRTGRPMPSLSVQLPTQQQAADVLVRYRDLRDAWQGPYTLRFEPQAEAFASDKRILEMTSTRWLSFRDFDDKVLLYFTSLMSYRGAIQSIRYGLNADAPTTEFTFPAWDKTGVATISPDMTRYLEIPATTTHAVVQLQYKDGSQSEVVKIQR